MVQLLRMDGTDIETYETTYWWFTKDIYIIIYIYIIFIYQYPSAYWCLVGNGWVAGGCWDEKLDS